MSKSYLQPDFVDVQVEDTTQFNDIEEGIEIHREKQETATVLHNTRQPIHSLHGCLFD